MYFKGTSRVKENEQEHGTVDPTDSDLDSDLEDDYLKLKTQVSRYYGDQNPTIKCRNCK